MIRKIQIDDQDAYIAMSKEFYSSEAVQHPIPEQYFQDTFDELMQSDAYTVCYIMEVDHKPAGYALLAKTFSQEAGGKVIWLDELYVRPSYRNCGLGHEFFSYLKNHLSPDVKRIRLEVEDDNTKAISLYKRMGFDYLPYSQMIIDY